VDILSVDKVDNPVDKLILACLFCGKLVENLYLLLPYFDKFLSLRTTPY
jgi:hypothetical protein